MNLYSVEYELTKPSDQMSDEEKQEFLDSQKDMATHVTADTYYDAVKKALTNETKFVRIRGVQLTAQHINIKG